MCVSFTDRTKTPRTKRQRQRKSLRKSARSSKSLEESCPTDCSSVMWGTGIQLWIFLFQTDIKKYISFRVMARKVIEKIWILWFQSNTESVVFKGFKLLSQTHDSYNQPVNSHTKKCLLIVVVGVCEAEGWWLHHSGYSQSSRSCSRR